MEEKNKFICSFCNKDLNNVSKMVSGTTTCICKECIQICNNLLYEEEVYDSINLVRENLPTPHEIHSFLDKYVIGQSFTKKMLSVAVYNHYKRLWNKEFLNSIDMTKSNVLLIGPTGSGKTLLAQTLARRLEVPFIIADATTLTEAGYVGEDVESILYKLLHICNYDIELAERAIIYIDEIDKISKKSENTSITRDVSGEGVQQALLKLIEGTIASVPINCGRKHPNQQFTQLDTTNILFIVGGAFSGLERVIRNRTEQSNMGFSAKIIEKGGKGMNELIYKVEPIDLIQFGLIPELVGRLPVISILNHLDEIDIMNILTEPNNSVIKQFKTLFLMEGVKLEIRKNALKAIACKAIKRHTGARGLRSILESVLLDSMYDLPSKTNISKVILDTISNNGEQNIQILYI